MTRGGRAAIASLNEHRVRAFTRYIGPIAETAPIKAMTITDSRKNHWNALFLVPDLVITQDVPHRLRCH